MYVSVSDAAKPGSITRKLAELEMYADVPAPMCDSPVSLLREKSSIQHDYEVSCAPVVRPLLADAPVLKALRTSNKS